MDVAGLQFLHVGQDVGEHLSRVWLFAGAAIGVGAAGLALFGGGLLSILRRQKPGAAEMTFRRDDPP